MFQVLLADSTVDVAEAAERVEIVRGVGECRTAYRVESGPLVSTFDGSR